MTFWVEVDLGTDTILGIDPEEVEAEHRKLVGVAWWQIGEVRGSPEVVMIMYTLSQPC